MAHGFTVQGGLGASASIIPHESSAHSVLVPDTELLFTAQFHRAGPDLVLTGRDGQHHLIPGYFSSEHHPALVAPNGAHLSPDTVDLLAGSPTPGHYAQAQGGAAPPDSIGKIEKVVGDVSVVRNGVTVALHVGDAVFKSDVVQTGASSACGISFPDGTALNLVANTRMALNDYTYDANSNSNGALFSLVEGTFAFVAGKVAHSGDMKIATPVATMGIRGTTGVVQEQPNAPATITATAADHTYSFAVVPDIGTGITGMWDVYLTDANGIIQRDANGNPIVLVTVSQSGYVTYVTPQGVGQAPLVTTEPATNSQYAFEQEMLSDLFRTLNPANLNNNNNGGSSTQQPPFALPNPIPQLFEDSGKPFTINGPGSGSSISVTINDTVGSSGPLTVVIWIAGGNGPWSRGPSWLGGAPPIVPQEVEILTPVKVTTDGSDAAAGLVVATGAILNIVSGTSFTIFDFIHGGGTIAINSSGSDPTLFIHGGVSLVGGGTIKMLGPFGEDNILGVPGTGAVLINVDYTIQGTGTIGGGDGNLTFENFGTVNANNGLLTINTGNQVYNDGLMEAAVDPLAATTSMLQIKDSVANAGTVQADGIGSAVTLSGATFDNLFWVVAKNGGSVTFTNVAVTNEAISTIDPTGGTINAAGGAITFDGGSIANGNMLEATNHGLLVLDDLTVTNSSAATASVDATSGLDLISAAILGGTIENAGAVVVTNGASVLHGDSVTNSGMMIVEAGASLTLEGDTTLLNEGTGQINADGGTVSIEIDADANVNSGIIEAVNGGEVDFYINVEGGSNHGVIEAGAGGTVHFFQVHQGGGGGGGQGGNYGTMEAADGGALIFDGGLDNFDLLESVNGGTVDLSNGAHNHVGGTILATGGGIVTIDSGLKNEATAIVKADDPGSQIDINGFVDNFGTIQATGANALVDLANGSVANELGGMIEADTGGTLTFDSTLNGAENGGTIKAGAGGTIVIDGFEGGNGLLNFDTNGDIGTIEAVGTGAKVELAGATIIGGKLGTTGSGVFETVSGTSTLMNVILTGGTFQVDSGTILDLNGGSNGVAAYIDSTVTLKGAGTVEMDVASYSIRGGLSNGTLNNQTTIEGQGTIGTGDTPLPGVLTLINSGTIEAVGGEFVINTGTRNSATTTNTGTLQALGIGAMLLIDFTNMNNAGGTIAALNDPSPDLTANNASKVELLDDIIVGGTLKTSDFGAIEIITNNGAASTTVFDGVTNLGYVFVNEKTTLVLRNTIDQTAPLDTATGKIALGDDGNATLAIDGTVTLSGGQVELNDSTDKIVALAPGATLHNTATIDGQGKIGADDLAVANHDLTFDNQAGGVVDSDRPDGTIVIWTGNTVTNAGTLEATNNGFLQIVDSVTNESAGTISASGLGSEVELLGATLDNFGQVVADLNSTISVTGGVTNESTGTIEATNSGTIFLSAVGVTNYDLIEADHGGRIFFQGGFSLSNLAGATIEATGTGAAINFNGPGTVTNDASTIEAINGGAITFDASVSSLVNKNSAVIEAGSGGTVTFAAITVTNSGGTIEALGSNSAVDLNGTTIKGGTLETDSGGVIDALTGTSTFDGVTIAGGVIKAESSATVDLEDTTTISGTVTFEGAGTFTLDPGVASIVGGATGGALDIAADVTLTGSGDIGNAGTAGATTLTLNNAGTIDADGDGASIDVDTGNTVTNTGLIEATNQGSLEIDDSVNNYGAAPGAIEASGGGSITLLGAEVDSGSATAGVAGGTIEADASSSIEFDTVTIGLGSSVAGGGGTLDAAGGTITVNNGELDVGSATAGGAGTVEASCSGSIALNGVTVNNDGGGTVKASHGGSITLSNGTLNDGSDTAGVTGGLVEATGCDSTVTFQGDTTVNLATTVDGGGGTVEATHGGAIIFDGSTITAAGATIEALHGGTITFETEGSLDASSATKGIAGGLIEASGDCSTITFDNFSMTLDSSVCNGGGTIEAACGGVIIFNGGTINSVDAAPTAGGLIEALAGSSITFNGTVVYNQGSTIEADGACATVVLNGATISGGTLETIGQGLIETGTGGGTLDGVTIASGSHIEVVNCTSLTLQGVIDSSGTITVDGHGTLELTGATLSGGTLAIDSGKVEVESTNPGNVGTLDGVTVTNDGTIQIDDPLKSATLVLDDDTTISGGIVSIGSTGTLDIETGASGSGATLDDVIVKNCGGEITVGAAATLTLDSVTVHHGAIDGTDAAPSGSVVASTIDVTGDSTFCNVDVSHGDLTVEKGITLTLDGGSVSDVTLQTDGDGLIAVGSGASTFDNLTLASGTHVEVDSGATLTLSHTLNNDGTITVDDGATLYLSNVALDGGTIKDNGTVEMTVDSTVGGGAVIDGDVGSLVIDSGHILTVDTATLQNLDVTNCGATVDIDSGTTLTLSDVTVHGGAIDGVDAAPSGSVVASTIDVTGDSTFCNVDLSGGDVTVESNVTLTLSGGSVSDVTITGTDAACSGDVVASTIDVTRDITFSHASLTSGLLTVDSGATLTTDTVTFSDLNVTDDGTLQIEDTLTLDRATIGGGGSIDDYSHSGPSGSIVGGTIDVTGDSALTNVTVDGSGYGQVTIVSGVTLSLDGTELENLTVNNSGLMQVESTLTLSNAAIEGGTVYDYATVSPGVYVGSTIDITGDNVIDADIQGAGLGQITVGDGVMVTLDGSTLQALSVSNGGTLVVDGNETLTLSAVSIDQGTIQDYSDTEVCSGSVVVPATIEVTGNTTITNATILGEDSPGETKTPGVIDVASGVLLTLGATTLQGIDVTNNGTLVVQGDTMLTLDGAGIDDGQIHDYGTNPSGSLAGATIDVTGDSAITNATITGEASPGSLATRGLITVDSGVTLTLDGSTLQDLDLTNSGTLVVDGNDTLTLNAAHIDGGTIDDYTDTSGVVVGATIDVTGDSAITNAIIDGEGGPATSGTPGALTVEDNVTLTLDGSTLEDLNVTNNGTLLVEGGTTLALEGASINGGTIDNYSTGPSGSIVAGTIDVTADSTLAGLTVVNGNLTIDLGSTLDVEKGSGNNGVTLDGVTVQDNGTIDIGEVATGAILTLDDGTTITGGATAALTINAHNVLDVENGPNGGGATLDDVHVTDNGALNIGDMATGAILTLQDDATITGGGTGTMTIHANNTVDVENGINIGATLDGVNVTLDGALDVGDVLSASGVILTLDDGTTITGNGAGTMTINANNTVDVEHGSNFDSGGATLDGVNVTDNGALDVGDVTSDGILTLDGGTSVTGSGAMTINAYSTLEVDDGTATINVGGTITNAGTIEAENGGVLTIDSDLSNSGHVQVISNGTVFIESNSITNAVGGTISADGSNSADIVIDCNSDSSVYDHGTFLNYGTVTSSNGGDIDIDSATITNEVGGTITSESTSSVFIGVVGNGPGTTTFGTLSNYGSITADASYIGIESTTITNELGGTITADGATAEIDFDDRASGISLSNIGTITASDGGLVKIDTSAVTNSGSLEATGGGELDITNSVTNTYGTLLAASGGKLDVESDISGGSATIQAGTLEFDASSSVNVSFDNSLDGGKGYGELILGDAADFSGQISNFDGTNSGLSNSDEVFLSGVHMTGPDGFSTSFSGDLTTLTIDEQSGGPITLYFVGDYAGMFKFVQGDDGLQIYDPPVGGAKQAPAPVTTAGDDHTSTPANEIAHVTDPATSPSNLYGFGGSDQDSTPAAPAHDNEVAASADQLALGGKSMIAPLGAPALGGVPADSSFVNGVADDSAGATLTNAGVSTQSQLSTLLKTLTGGTDGIAASSIDPGHDQIAPVLAPATPANEHAAAPTIASASFGAMGNDNFAFHPNLGSGAAQNTSASANELAHSNVQLAGPALASTAPEFHAEFAFDAIHQDGIDHAATVDQFHQMAANSTLLH